MRYLPSLQPEHPEPLHKSPQRLLHSLEILPSPRSSTCSVTHSPRTKRACGYSPNFLSEVGQIDSIDIFAYVEAGLSLNKSTTTLEFCRCYSYQRFIGNCSVRHLRQSSSNQSIDAYLPQIRLEHDLRCGDSLHQREGTHTTHTPPESCGQVPTQTRAELPIPTSHWRESSYKAGEKSHMHIRVFDTFQEDQYKEPILP